jgi:hypothetical protein
MGRGEARYIVTDPCFATGQIMLQIYPVISPWEITPLMRRRIDDILTLTEFFNAAWSFHCE